MADPSNWQDATTKLAPRCPTCGGKAVRRDSGGYVCEPCALVVPRPE
jgi:ribosomal protein L37AE/L43A